MFIVTQIASGPTYKGKVILTCTMTGRRVRSRAYSTYSYTKIATNWIMRYEALAAKIDFSTIRVQVSDHHDDYFIRDLWLLRVDWSTRNRA